jgi:hypothetical protein
MLLLDDASGSQSKAAAGLQLLLAEYQAAKLRFQIDGFSGRDNARYTIPTDFAVLT